MDKNIYQNSKIEPILLVESCDATNDFFKGLLVEAGYKVYSTNNTKEALEYIKTVSFGVVITELQVKEENDGIELCKKIKLNSTTKNVSTMVLTTQSKEQEGVQTLESGADVFVSKFEPYDLIIAEVNALVRIREVQKMILMKKLEATRAVVTTLNHEINNPLTIVLLNLEMTEQKCLEDDPNHPVIKYLQSAIKSLDRIKLVVKTLDAISSQIPMTSYSDGTEMLDYEYISARVKKNAS